MLKAWLGEDGVAYFRDIKSRHGTLNAVWMEGGIPHPVHFREGMQVRNKLRDLTPGRGDHWYDDNWINFVERAIE